MNWNNKEEVIKTVKEGGWALEFASEELRYDKEVVLEAVNNYGWALKYASYDLRNDKEVVLAAVGNCGWALKFASKELQNDKDVVLEAVVMNVRNYLAKKVHNYIKDVDYYDYQDNLDFCETEEDKIKEIEKELLTLKGTKNIIDYLQELEEDSEECMDENKDILTLVEKHSYALQFVSEEIISPPKSKTVDVPSQTSIKENAHRAVEKANANKSTPQRNKDKDISR